MKVMRFNDSSQNPALIEGNSDVPQPEPGVQIDESARNEQAKLDGCYVLKTDRSAAQASKELVHDRYKDLTLVEQAFRTWAVGSNGT